jgi:hypothetical protein
MNSDGDIEKDGKGFIVQDRRASAGTSPTLPGISADIEAVMAHFRKRAKRLRLSAFLFLILILISLIAGVWLFYFAGTIVRDEQIQTGEDRYAGMLNFQIEDIRNAIEKDTNPDSRDKALAQLAVTIKEVAAAQINRELASEKGIEQRQKAAQYRQTITLISTVTTRVGSVFMLLFLVQLLISMYRYDIKLAGYYEARADALQLLRAPNEARLEAFVRAFSPDAVDFGRIPKTPIEHALLLAKEITALSKKG